MAPPVASRQEVINYASQEARRIGLPRSWFLAMLHAESGFSPDVGQGPRRSSAGAIGYGQLMPGTARGLGVDPYDWRQNIRGAAIYLKRQYDQFHSFPLALSAYNSGPGGSEASGKVEGFAETQAYVKRVAQLEARYRTQGGNEPIIRNQEAQTVRDVNQEQGQAVVREAIVGAPTELYKGAIARLGPLSSRAAESAARFVPRAPVAAPAEPQTQPGGAFQPQGTGGPVRPDFDDGWQGSRSIAQGFLSLGQANGLKVMSEKRDRRDTTSGNRSDHWTGSRDSFAYDLSNGNKPTEEMDNTARAIAARLGFKWNGGELNRTVAVNGYRIQVLYRTNVGGNHFNHIHVGVRRVGGGKK